MVTIVIFLYSVFMKNIKALAIDLDGTTLLPNASLGERTLQCLKKLMAGGMQVIICTGRAVESSARYYNAIGAAGPMVFFNGAEVVNVPDIKIVRSNFLDLDVVDYGIDLARNMDIHLQIFLPLGITLGFAEKAGWETLLIDRPRAEAGMYQEHTGIQPVVTDLKAAITAPGLTGCPKIMFIVDPAAHDTIRREMTARFGSRIYIARTFPTFLEIMNVGVSKGEGLKIAMEHRGLKPEEVIAFGDEENDMPMFRVAGYSAAPSNARENVRQAADFVFGSNAEEGLAAFLDEFFPERG